MRETIKNHETYMPEKRLDILMYPGAGQCGAWGREGEKRQKEVRGLTIVEIT